MSFLLALYVRIILPDIEAQILTPLNTLKVSIKNHVIDLIKELEKRKETDLASALKTNTSKPMIYCWKKPCSKDDMFENLFSVVEKIDGEEADVFELEFRK